MKRFSLQYLVIVCCIISFTGASAVAGETGIRTYSLPNHGALHLRVPVSWTDKVRQPQNQLPPTITFSQSTGDSFKVLMTTLWPADKQAVFPDTDKMRQMVQQSAQKAAPQSVEKFLDVVEIKGMSGTGFYYSATDRAPEPGGYKYLTQGLIPAGQLIITFTILTNDGQKDVVTDTLTMLKTAKHK